MDIMSTIKEVAQIIQSHRQSEGAGFIVRRPIPNARVEAIDPFLLIDEMGPIEYQPGQAVGAPDHPHRGFETVTYVLDGEMHHEDSAGHQGFLSKGSVQWMTAGAGIVHSEEPSKRMREQGGRMHGFQIWVNLPKALKLTRPRYQEISGDKVPAAQTADGKARVKVIAGEALGVRAVIDTHTPIVYQDWTLEPEGEVTLPMAAGLKTLVYVFEGEVLVGEGGKKVVEGELAVLDDGEAVRLRGGATQGRLLLLAGAPLKEPIARYGPFVMNTRQELIQAFEDFESGNMGEITRTAQLS
jgi:redox-sensitive bicupin YhaK (pirin superfamily)